MNRIEAIVRANAALMSQYEIKSDSRVVPKEVVRIAAEDMKKVSLIEKFIESAPTEGDYGRAICDIQELLKGI